MTDQGGYGGWSPQRRPDEPDADDTSRAAESNDRPDRSDPSPAGDAPRGDSPAGEQRPPTYGAPSYGAPSYGAPSYGGSEPSSPPPPYGSPGQQSPSYEQPTQQAPSYGQSGPYGGQQDTPQYGAPSSPPSSAPSYGSYQPPGQGGPGQGHQGPSPDSQQTQVFAGYGGGYGGGPGQPGGPGQYGAPGGAPPAKKRSGGRIALIIGLVVVLVAGLGVGAWALFLRGGPAVTWQGKEVTNAEELLTQAQSDLNTLVTEQKGVKADDTRCYYAVPKNPPKDAETDVSDTVYCGPALFVDGDTKDAFIPSKVNAGSTSGDEVTLSIATKGTAEDATAVPGDQELVRPDGQSAPSGAGGLKVPEPPPADENVFVAVEDLDVPDAPAGTTMASLDGGVTVEKLGEVKRYGTGADARSAPDGQKLIAFQLADAAGDGSSDGASVLDLTVQVDGGDAQEIPELLGLNVIAVPTDAKTVDLVTKANAITQTLSLLDGKAGAGNLAVLARENRFGSFTVPGGFSFTETGGGASAQRPCTLTGSVAGLFFWADSDGSAAATGAGNAILETDLKYTFSTGSPPPFTGSNAGDTATFEPSHLTLTLPDGTVIPAKLLADRTVFEVPAGFTDGTISVGGAFTNTNAITFTVNPPGVSFPVSIPTS